MVFNKIDRFGGNGLLQKYLDQYPKAVAVSARTGEGIPALIQELGTQLRPIREFVELRVPHGDSAVIARLHQVAQVIERNYEGAEARFKARIPPHFHAEFAPYIVRHLQNGKPARSRAAEER
jgi:GTP-binding protein HflX